MLAAHTLNCKNHPLGPWPARERMHNSRKPFTRGNQPVVQKLSCMMFFFAPPTSSCSCHPCHKSYHAGVFPQKCVRISVHVQSQDCVPTNAVQERAPERATNSAANSATNFWKCAKHYARACFRFAGMFAGMFAGTFVDLFADPFADKCCAHCLRVVCVKGICGRN